MNFYSDQQQYAVEGLDQRLSTVMRGVYFKMFLGLIASAVTAWIAAASATPYYLATHHFAYWGLAILELVLVIAISSGLRKLSSGVATGLFYLFAVVNGLTLSLIFVAYSLPSIGKTFLITAAVFGAMSLYGYFTTRSLAKMGSFLYMALFGLIAMIVVNLFLKSSGLEWAISGIGVVLFIGLTAWDTQQIKQMAMADPTMANGRLSTLGALSLYLDFINLFLYLLRFFGSSRD